MEILTSPIVSLLVLIGVMVFIHELGHYLAAIWFNVRVEAFSLGFGPRLLGFRKGETDFKICAIPLGGYVKMAGEMYGDGTSANMQHADDPRSFLAKPRWQRLIIAFAGPAMNILLAIVLLTGLYMYRFPKVLVADGAPTVTGVVPNSPAAKAGLQEGDRIVAINGQANPRWDDVFRTSMISVNQPVEMTIERGSEQRRLTMTPAEDANNGLGDLGIEGAHEVEVGDLEPNRAAIKSGMKPGDTIVAIDGAPIRSANALIRAVRASQGREIVIDVQRDGQPMQFRMTPESYVAGVEKEPQWRIGIRPQPKMSFVSLPFGDAFGEAISRSRKDATSILELLGGMVKGRISTKAVDGPVGLASVASRAAKEGFHEMVELMANVSLNLAVINLLPIPILDGGMILMLLIEMAARRDLSLKLKEAVLKFGLAFLLVVVALVLYSDITKQIAR